MSAPNTVDSDSEDELPPFYEERVTDEGIVYYLNHQDKTTQWTHPRTGRMKKMTGDLPYGWETKVEESSGKTIFVDHEKKQTTYTDPRLAFATEEFPQNIGELRQRFDASTTALQILHGRDLTGKLAIITGANCGIGLETAKSLAFHGCEIVMACRNESATLAAIDIIKNERPTAGSKCSFMHLDLSSLQSTREFVRAVIEKYRHIDYLILNAGVFALPHSLTVDQIETTFQVSHLSHFYLTLGVSDLLDCTSRVIVLASESHRMSNFPISDLTESIVCPPPSKFWSMLAYNNAKLCNVLFTRELARKWQERGISVFAVHPGNMVSTNIQRNWWFYKLIFLFVRPFTKTMQQAAGTTIYAATAKELTGFTGLYLNNCYVCEPSVLAKREKLGKSLWTLSEEMVNRVLNGIDGNKSYS